MTPWTVAHQVHLFMEISRPEYWSGLPFPSPSWQIDGGNNGNSGQEKKKARILIYAEYIMRNAGLDEAQAGIKIAGRNINNLRYADDTTLMIESEDELKSLLMKVKEESEKAG